VDVMNVFQMDRWGVNELKHGMSEMLFTQISCIGCMMYYYEVKPCREAYIIIFFYFNILYFQRGEAIL